MRHYHTYKELLQNNALWAEKKTECNSAYFAQLAEYQAPPFLYIGCSDSRIPIDTLTQTEPGELFIHRNIANQISLTDMNFLSVLEFAVEELKVAHIIICGHTECGGIKGAYHNNLRGLKENWVTSIKDVIRQNQADLEALKEEGEKLDRLSELNVLAQVQNLFKVSLIERLIEAKEGYCPQIHAWVLQLKTGKIKELSLPLQEWKSKGIVPMAYQQQ